MLCCNYSLVVVVSLDSAVVPTSMFAVGSFSGRVFPNNSDDKTLNILTLVSENGNGLLRVLTEIIFTMENCFKLILDSKGFVMTYFTFSMHTDLVMDVLENYYSIKIDWEFSGYNTGFEQPHDDNLMMTS